MHAGVCGQGLKGILSTRFMKRVGVCCSWPRSQIIHPMCSHGVTSAVPWHMGGNLLIGGGDGSISMFDFHAVSHDAPPVAVLPGAVTALCLAANRGAILAATLGGHVVR
jgi:hypothetical protein